MDVFDQSLKPKKPNPRQVKSRFLPPNSISSPENGFQSPKNTLSPLRQNGRSSTDSRKHKSLEKSGFLRGLWPSSTPSPPSKSKLNTLADHLGNDRIKDLKERKNSEKADDLMLLNRQRSCSEFSRFENDQKKIAKENHKPGFGGSMRYTGRLKFPGRSTSSSSSKNSTSVDNQNDYIAPGRFSVDETSLRGKTFSDTQDSDSEYSDVCSGTSLDVGQDFPASYMGSTVSSRKHGIAVASKYMNDSSSRSRRWSADSGIQKTNSSSDNSPKRLTSKNSMKNSSKWELSPGHPSSPLMLGDNKGNITGLSNSKPPSSPSRAKGVGSFLSMGIELLKGKKSSPNTSSPLGLGSSDSVHQLRLLHNRLMQWRYSNARAETVNGNIIKKAESNLLCAWDGLIKVQHSVLQKKLQLQKEKLGMKLNYILHSQIRVLETWGNMERDHISAVSTTKLYLHSVVCRMPLVEGAKVEPQSASIAIRHASDVSAFINLILTKSAPTVETTSEVLVELARVVTQEKLLLQECLELLKTISTLQVKERTLKCSIMQIKSFQPQHYHQEVMST
ncbi:QWRF motif-containing protein 3-like [Olea europaea var. sylvestris]|uniref:QWRF motif-containing protein 3-like n=1 Tax=Olea europaea var. sylvestris TaxID=158386 RepID=UPI000C1CF27B|nr:QWRF motif-containing protein 3-like [Olea europaea var. sylvestris]